MDDKTETIVDGFISNLLHLRFERPRGWSDEKTTLYIGDLKEEIIELIQYSKRIEKLSEMLEKARKRIIRTHKYRSWPSIAEIIDALKYAAQPSNKKHGGARNEWPHRNSQYMIESALRWIDKHGEWPHYHSSVSDDHIADAVISSGMWTRQQLIDLGYRPQMNKPNNVPATEAPA